MTTLGGLFPAAFLMMLCSPGVAADTGVAAWLKIAPPIMPNHHLSQDKMYRLAAFIMSMRVGD
jgi:hypothetical protein